MQKIRLLTILLSVGLIISLCSCDLIKSKNNSGNSKAVSTGDIQSDDSLAELRNTLRSEGCLCGALYIGYVEKENSSMSNNREEYEKLFAEDNHYDRFPFLKNFPAKQFVSSPMGHELYLIIPCAPDAKVTVNQLELGEKGIIVSDSLYTSESGEPFLLQCNYSDIFSDAEVIITGSDGEILKWSPFMSLRDGKLQTEAEDGKKVYDFTEYEFISGEEVD